MINSNEVIKYIEESKNTTLLDYQRKFIENLIVGKTTRMPRNSGITYLINAYTEYLKNEVDQGSFAKRRIHPEDIKWDDQVSYDEVLDDRIKCSPEFAELNQSEIISNYQQGIKNQDNFKRDYNIEFDDFVSKYINADIIKIINEQK